MFTVIETPTFQKLADKIWNEDERLDFISWIARNMDIEKIAKAIEKDAGQELPELRQSLSEVGSDSKGRTYTKEQLIIREARKQTGLSQKDFAQLIKTPTSTLQDWEQGRFPPPGGVICLMEIIIKHPEIADELVA